MPSQSDQDYAKSLIELLRADCDRLRANASWNPVVALQAEEIRVEAGRLNIPSTVARTMRELADEAIGLVKKARTEAGGQTRQASA